MAETWRVSPWLSEVDSPASPLLGEVDADVVIGRRLHRAFRGARAA